MIKAIKKLNKMCKNGLGIWLAAVVFFVGALQLLIHSLSGEIPLWRLVIGEYMMFFSGILFTVYGRGNISPPPRPRASDKLKTLPTDFGQLNAI